MPLRRSYKCNPVTASKELGTMYIKYKKNNGRGLEDKEIVLARKLVS